MGAERAPALTAPLVHDFGVDAVARQLHRTVANRCPPSARIGFMRSQRQALGVLHCVRPRYLVDNIATVQNQPSKL